MASVRAARFKELELQFLCAEQDGVEPAVLISAGGSKGPQYLVNVPEGFSRLALEHRVRPTANFRAALCLSNRSADMGGLPGLIMRLRHDGHEKFSVIGPQGTTKAVAGYQNFMTWKHPQVLVSDMDPAVPREIYQDEYLAFLPLAGCPSGWQAPSWITRQQSSLALSTATPQHASVMRTRAESPSSGSEAHTEDSSDTDDTASASGGVDETRNTKSRERKFAALDKLLGSEGVNAQDVLSTLTARRRAPATASGQPTSSLPSPHSSRSEGGASCSDRGQTSRDAEPGTGAGNSSNPVVSKSKVTAGNRGGGMLLWGFAVWVRQRNEVLLFIKCNAIKDLKHMMTHPIFQRIDARRVVAVVHLTPSAVLVQKSYQAWLGKLPGKQVCLSYPNSELGFLSSARAVARLNCLSPILFGLPPSLHSTGTLLGNAKENVVHGKLLLKLRLSEEGLNLDESECPSPISPSELQEELMSQQPDLGGIVAGLKSTALWGEQAVNRINDAAKLEQESVTREQQATQQSQHMPGVPPQGPLAQVLHFGRPVGVVQLTQAGRVGPPGVLSGFGSAVPPAKRQKLEQNAGKPAWQSEDIDLPEDDESPAAEEGGIQHEEQTTGLLEDSKACQQLDASMNMGDGLLPVCWEDGSHRQWPGGEPAELTFLGTGSAEPSKYRGASGMHLRLGDGQGILIEAGEGVYGQMTRLYGAFRAKREAKCQVQVAESVAGSSQLLWLKVAQLGLVFVSHRHADHMLGLPGILEARPSHCPPLLVIGPTAAQRWLTDLKAVDERKYCFVTCRQCRQGQLPGQLLQQCMDSLGLAWLATVAVAHCSDAWGIVFRHRRGWSICFSGDTRPCQNLVQAGAGCTLLVHEATFEADRQQEAVAKRHSTTAEALQIATEMGAYRTVLTHFSQRYPKLPPGLETWGPANAIAAFDGMTVPLKCLEDLPLMLPALQAALREVDESAAEAQEGLAQPETGSEAVNPVSHLGGSAVREHGHEEAENEPNRRRGPTHVRFEH